MKSPVIREIEMPHELWVRIAEEARRHGISIDEELNSIVLAHLMEEVATVRQFR
jgi:hypothetical protein